jgi:hypothetical protein
MIHVIWYRDGKIEMSLELPEQIAKRLVKLCLSPVVEITSGGIVIGYNIYQNRKLVNNG